MKIAVLVLACHAPEVLLQHAILLSEVDFIVHVDAKTDSRRFSTVASLPNVKMMSERTSIFWRGWTMIVAEIALMRVAITDGYDRIVLLSDDSFAIKCPTDLISEITLPINRIQTRSAPDLIARYKGFFYQDCPATSARGFYNEERAFASEDFPNLHEMEALMSRGKKLLDTLYYGAQWWCLTREAAEHVLHVHDTDEHLRKSFQFSSVPDEHYIHTILHTASITLANRGVFIWADWTRNPKPYIFRDMTELSEPIASPFLFVRKIHDPALAEALSHQLLP